MPHYLVVFADQKGEKTTQLCEWDFAAACKTFCLNHIIALGFIWHPESKAQFQKALDDRDYLAAYKIFRGRSSGGSVFGIYEITPLKRL